MTLFDQIQEAMSPERKAEIEAEAKRLIEQGYHQTSRNYRSVARLPPGMTAVEACKLLDPQKEKIWREHYERCCAQTVLGAVHWSASFKDECYKELDEATFAEFRRQGGRPL